MLMGVMLVGSIAFTAASYEPKDSTAEVEREEGLYVFYRSKPVKDYEHLGTYKIGFIMDTKPKLLFNKLVRKVTDKYPEADAIVISDDMEKCDAIKFKK